MSTVTLGGERLGSGKKMKVSMHGFERSTHNLSRIRRTTMAAGTLVPVLKEIGLPGDSWDIDTELRVLTNPPVGPVFGSFKTEVDFFLAPIRLYQGLMSMNLVDIGLTMEDVLLPQMKFTVPYLPEADLAKLTDLDNYQINPSCILKYLGIRGFGMPHVSENKDVSRQAVYLLAYWDLYKCYYANKQEKIGAVIHTPVPGDVHTVDTINVVGGGTIEQSPTVAPVGLGNGDVISIDYTTGVIDLTQIVFWNSDSVTNYTAAAIGNVISDNGTTVLIQYDAARYGSITIANWDYTAAGEPVFGEIGISTFPLENIDTMRKNILTWVDNPTPFEIFAANLTPYAYLTQGTATQKVIQRSQEGLALKCYNSDIFNNWLNTENINAINNSSQVAVTGGVFSINVLIMAKKLFDEKNRIAMSGGTLDDWQMAVYDHERIKQATSPMYMGGVIQELVFQEVVSNSESGGTNGNSTQPLGTIAGKGALTGHKKGGRVNIDVSEPSVILAVASITPRIDYSQGNDWDVELESIDDLHKPTMDQIGFQDLTTGKMAWWTKRQQLGGQWIEPSAGKQPAWLDYMTSYNQVFGNFAIENNQMFMVLTRRYMPDQIGDYYEIEDLTTYIDPRHFNHIFAQTDITAQNFWVQIGFDITVRRKMSAKLMPNL